MPSAFTHIFVAEMLWKTRFPEEPMATRFWVLTAVCSILPDVDVAGFYLGVKYGELFAPRGFFQSLYFALIVALLVVLFAFPAIARFSRRWWALLAFFFVVTASHGLLDSMTDKGMGVGFFIPFENTRYFMLWRPVDSSPMSIPRFFGHAGLHVLYNEIIWIWTPMIALYGLATLSRKRWEGAAEGSKKRAGG
jgi:inner membrane protein